MKKRVVLIAAVVALGAAIFAVRAPAITSENFDGAPRIVAATFTSAWCSSCKIIEPRLAKIVPSFAGTPVKFVEYDLTFGQRDELRASAQADGIADVYDIYSKATGYTVLVDVQTGQVLDTLTINHSADAMRAAVAAALAVAEQR